MLHINSPLHLSSWPGQEKLLQEIVKKGGKISNIKDTNIFKATLKKKSHYIIDNFHTLIPYNLGLILTSPFYIHEILQANNIKSQSLVRIKNSDQYCFGKNSSGNQYNILINKDGYFHCDIDILVNEYYVDLSKKVLKAFPPAPYLCFTLNCDDISKKSEIYTIADLSLIGEKEHTLKIIVDMLFPQKTTV